MLPSGFPVEQVLDDPFLLTVPDKRKPYEQYRKAGFAKNKKLHRV
ncbi:MAG TPA: hypothetical protein VNK96_09595 [Fimbriimonadales bacterium]|nr:hypothetical protein [Fimbriimonadales bacterium]